MLKQLHIFVHIYFFRSFVRSFVSSLQNKIWKCTYFLLKRCIRNQTNIKIHSYSRTLNESMEQAKKKCNLLIFFVVFAHFVSFICCTKCSTVYGTCYTSHIETVYAITEFATKKLLHSDRYKLQFHFECFGRACVCVCVCVLARARQQLSSSLAPHLCRWNVCFLLVTAQCLFSVSLLLCDCILVFVSCVFL